MRTVLNFAVLTGLLFLSACVGPAPTPCTTCDNQCVDLKTDSKNCGVCGTACATGSV